MIAAITFNLPLDIMLYIGGGITFMFICYKVYMKREVLLEADETLERVKQVTKITNAEKNVYPVHVFHVDRDGDPTCPKCDMAFHSRGSWSKKRRLLLSENKGWLCTCPLINCKYTYVMQPNDRITEVISLPKKEIWTLKEPGVYARGFCEGESPHIDHSIKPDDLVHEQWYHAWNVESDPKYMGAFQYDLKYDAHRVYNFENIDNKVTFLLGDARTAWSQDGSSPIENYMFVKADIDCPKWRED